MKTITLSKFIDNMEKNGYEQAFGGLMFNKEGNKYNLDKKSNVGSACALGQGMLNLNFKSLTWSSSWGIPFVKRVAHLNDVEKKTPEQIAKIVRKEYEKYLRETISGYTWNEHMPYHGNGSIR